MGGGVRAEVPGRRYRGHPGEGAREETARDVRGGRVQYQDCGAGARAEAGAGDHRGPRRRVRDRAASVLGGGGRRRHDAGVPPAQGLRTGESHGRRADADRGVPPAGPRRRRPGDGAGVLRQQPAGVRPGPPPPGQVRAAIGVRRPHRAGAGGPERRPSHHRPPAAVDPAHHDVSGQGADGGMPAVLRVAAPRGGEMYGRRADRGPR
mmetsp:Transcript_32430/g.64297  ORF Transcript_32430/g.64297 Transcript_32430/m.64297 type:complete len:207 (+) Transcript_32430:404-1024(+)